MPAIATNEQTSLEQVLAYRHSGVVRRFCKEHNAMPREAEEIFREMLKFLYVCHRAGNEGPEGEGFGFVVCTDIEKIDWMWHIFLLFTREYADFCESHFGAFLHHLPNVDDEQADAPMNEVTLRAAMDRQLALVYDVLGEETLIDWYDRRLYAAAA